MFDIDMKIVIIGNSAASAGAIEAIRKKDPFNDIIVISDEPYTIYSRPLLPYFLSKEIKPSKIYFRPKDYYEKNKVKPILGKKVERVCFDENRVLLKDGEELYYDKLLIATGGKPIIPEINGIEKEGIFFFTKFDDAKAISTYLKRVKKAIVIGGGPIGIRAAEALMKRKIEVTIIELSKHILSLTLDDIASSILERALIKRGVKIITSNTVEEIIGDSHVESVRLVDGKTLKTDMVIIAIGVIPNVEPFKGGNLNINKGIVVNERMETNIKNVYSAGDVIESYDKILGNYRTIPIWPYAYRQGSVAGGQIIGDEESIYEGGFMMNSIEVANIPVVSIGLVNLVSNNGYEVIKKIDKNSNSYRKIILNEGSIVGALFLGKIDRAGIITGLLRDGVKINRFKMELKEGSFGLISLPRELRREKILNTK